MSFRIASSSVPMQASRHLAKAQLKLERSLGALASGSRVVRVGDDAAGFAISESLRGQVGGTKQAKFNAESATRMVQTAEGGLNEQNNILVRMRELAVYSASDTVSEDERKYLDTEFKELRAEFDRIAQSTRYGSRKLLTGTGEEFEFQVGAFQGDENIVKFELNADTTGGEVGIDGLSVTDQDDARDALEELDQAMGKISTARATFGSMQSRLGYTINALAVQAENLEAARSNMADTDYAEEVSNLASAQIQQQAATSVIAQARTSAVRALQLIDG